MALGLRRVRAASARRGLRGLSAGAVALWLLALAPALPAPAPSTSALPALAAPGRAAAQTPRAAPSEAAAESPALDRVPVEVEPADPFVRPSATVLRGRRDRLLESIGTGAVLLRSAVPREQQRDYPQDAEFRQHNDFFYLTGLETPHSWLLLVARDTVRRSVTLFVPERDPAEEMWTGPRPSPSQAAHMAGIDQVRTSREAARLLSPEALDLPPGMPLYLPTGTRTGQDPIVQRLAGAGRPVRDLDPQLAALRLVKDEFEIEILRRAIEVTAGAHRAAMHAARPGMYEYELEAVIEFNFRLGGAERVGFPSIVGSGPNSVILHYDTNRRRMEEGDLVVIDIGAEYSYYTADVTRTLPVSGTFTERQRRIYDLVLGAQQAAMDSVRPGVTVARLDQIARGWMRANSGDACGRRTCDAYFVHGLSHWLGMDVHDVGDYGTPLAPGMVLTVEPGIYLPRENLGVRIEDDVLVTEDGYELLSGGAPRQAAEIEALMREGRAAAVGGR